MRSIGQCRSVRGHLCWHRVVDVDGVIDLVLGAAALLHRAEVLLVALETGKLPSHHQLQIIYLLIVCIRVSWSNP